MKLTEVIAVWMLLHTKDTGKLRYCDLQDAIESLVGIENDVDASQPVAPLDVIREQSDFKVPTP